MCLWFRRIEGKVRERKKSLTSTLTDLLALTWSLSKKIEIRFAFGTWNLRKYFLPRRQTTTSIRWKTVRFFFWNRTTNSTKTNFSVEIKKLFFSTTKNIGLSRTEAAPAKPLTIKTTFVVEQISPNVFNQIFAHFTEKIVFRDLPNDFFSFYSLLTACVSAITETICSWLNVVRVIVHLLSNNEMHHRFLHHPHPTNTCNTFVDNSTMSLNLDERHDYSFHVWSKEDTFQ